MQKNALIGFWIRKASAVVGLHPGGALPGDSHIYYVGDTAAFCTEPPW